MKLVYTAGPYRSERGPYGIVQNIRSAEAVAVELWRMGLAVICPHKNSALLDGALGVPYEEREWFDGDLEMVRRCDALVLCPGWKKSVGALREREEAEAHGIPVFEWPRNRGPLSVFAGEGA